MTAWDDVDAGRKTTPYHELDEPVDGGPLGNFYDNVIVMAGGVQLPPSAQEAGAPRGLPVLRFQFTSSSKEHGPPDLTVSLLLTVETLHDLRMVFGDAIDSAAKLGRKIR